MNGGVVSCCDIVDVIKDSRWLGLVVHEPGARAIALSNMCHASLSAGGRCNTLVLVY